MSKSVCTIVLNRNLQSVTDKLCEQRLRFDGDLTDVAVVEAGSDNDQLSKHCRWHANWQEAREHGLRVPRGFNYALSELSKSGEFGNYDYYFLLTNDTEFKEEPVLAPLLSVMEEHRRLGILSPCSKAWGEKLLLQDRETKYFWYAHNTAYLLRREFMEQIMETVEPDTMRCLYDGTNFRGYGTELELVAKGYINDWATAITTKVWAEENESHLLSKSDLIKTERYDQNLKLYFDEGRAWMRRKYGFNSRWAMQVYVKAFYEDFFTNHPELKQYRI